MYELKKTTEKYTYNIWTWLHVHTWRLHNKEHGARLKKPPFKLWGQDCRQSSIGHCFCPWFPSITTWQDPVVEDITHFRAGSRKNKPQTDQETYSLLASFHSARRCYVVCQGRKEISGALCIPIGQERCAHWSDRGTHVIGQPTAFWLNLRLTPQKGISCLVL